jgi:hypothetical protein
MGQHAIEALGEDLAWAIWHIAEPASAMQSQAHGFAAPGQIERPPKISAVLPSTQLAALRAWNGRACWFGDEHQTAITLDGNQDHAPVINYWPTRFGHRFSPR